MTTTIDSAGRIVVPQRLREELGFRPGQELELSAVDGRLEAVHPTTPMHLEEHEGRLVAVADRRDADADAGARARDAGTDSSVSSPPAAATPDSSVVIAAFASWNQYHGTALEALGDARDLVAHVELEANSALTRLPEPFRAAPPLVAEYLRKDYPGK